jgi:hypothetical protein
VTTRFVGNRTLSAAEAMCSRPASVRVGGFAFIRPQLSRCRLSLSASGPAHAGAGGARNRTISDRMSANICRDTATSALWQVTYRPWVTTFAPILISFSRKLVNDHLSAAFGIASVRIKLPMLGSE